MSTKKTSSADGVSAENMVITGDLVVDGKQFRGMLNLAKYLVLEKQQEFVEEIRPMMPIGLIVENQQHECEEGLIFVYWPDGHTEIRPVKDLVKIEDLETFIQESLIWHV